MIDDINLSTDIINNLRMKVEFNTNLNQLIYIGWGIGCLINNLRCVQLSLKPNAEPLPY
ncbi:hypothetical protein [Nostoc sp.]|uniref:hypothetical protein n=1 Tax=Nostoc sp. TaxID=1180 RepID=UPI002FF853F8